MSLLRACFAAGALALSAMAACNYTEGECYPRGQVPGDIGSGAGGDVILPSGAGGLGDAPPEPQNADDPPTPDCNIATQSPCYEKCLADYEEAAANCTKITSVQERQQCNDNAYSAYKNCRESCQEKANQECDDKYQNCIDNGASSCQEREGGKTLCQRCWERCNAGDAPSAKCQECKF